MKKMIAALTMLGAVAGVGISHDAEATNLRAVRLRTHDAVRTFNQGGNYTQLTTTWYLDNIGYNHLCEILVSPDGWATYSRTNMSFDHVEGGSEVWRATVSTGTGQTQFVEYSVSCTDLSEPTTVYAPNAGANLSSYGLTIRGAFQRLQTHS